MIAALRPGLSVAGLLAIYEESLASQGLAGQWQAMQACSFLYAGHGIGLEIHEPPLIGAGSDYRVDSWHDLGHRTGCLLQSASFGKKPSH